MLSVFLTYVAITLSIVTTPAVAHNSHSINFENVQDAFLNLQEQMLDTTNVIHADPGLLRAVSDTPGFTASILERVVMPTQNISISGVVATDNILNKSISQLLLTSSLAPSTKVPQASYKGKYKGGIHTLNFQMISKQLVCKMQDEKAMLKQSHATDLLRLMKDKDGYKFIGFSFVGNKLAGGYAENKADGSLSAIFVSVFDGNLLAMASEDKAKRTMVQLLFTSYNGERPASNEVTVPPNLLSLCQ